MSILVQSLKRSRVKPRWQAPLGVMQSVVAYNCRKYGFPIPILAMPFIEGAGKVAHDFSGNGNHGTITGAIWSSGRSGNALSFDGSDDNIKVLSNSTFHALPALTYYLHFYHNNDATVDERFIVIENVGATGYLLLHLNDVDQAIHFIVDYQSTDLKKYSAANPFLNNQWNSVMVTWDGSPYHSNVHIYVNGVELSYTESSTDGVFDRISDSTNDLLIGNRLDGLRGFDGKIENVQIYRRVLTSAQRKFLLDNPYFLYEMPEEYYEYVAAGGFQSSWARNSNQLIYGVYQ